LFDADKDDMLVVFKDFTSAKTLMLVGDLQAFFASKDVSLLNSEGSFVDGNALFTQNRMYFGERRLRNLDFTWMILPMPMYDTKQDGYITTVANPFTLWGISHGTTSDMRKECTAVLESLAMDAAIHTTSAVIDSNLPESMLHVENAELKKMRKEVALQLRESVVLDHGRMVPNVYVGTYIIELFAKSITINTDFVSLKAAHLTLVRQGLKRAFKKTGA